jgi:hypothetical protein
VVGPVSAGSQTRSNWDTASAIPPPPRSRVPLIAGSLVAVLLLAGGGVLAFRKLQAPPAPVPEPAATGQLPASPIPSTMGETPKPPPQASVTATATVPPADTAAPQPEPPHLDKPAAVPTPKGPGPGKKGKPVPTGTPAAGTSAPTAPPKPPVDDFGDRK